MSVSSVFSNNPLNQAGDSQFGQRRADFRQLISALKAGDLSAAQQAYSQLQSDLGTTQADGSARSGNRFQNLLSQIGSALQSGDLSGAQQALANFRHHDASTQAGSGRAAEGPGAFLDAVFQALSQAGVSTTAANDSTSATASASAAAGTSGENPLQALGAFMHDLFAALQSQGGQTATGSPSSATAGDHHQRRAGDLGQIESKLQSLIQQLSSSTSDTSASGGASTANSSPAVSALQQSYQDLLGSLGVSGSAATLGSFLQALAQNLQGLGSSGNVVNTQT